MNQQSALDHRPPPPRPSSFVFCCFHAGWDEGAYSSFHVFLYHTKLILVVMRELLDNKVDAERGYWNQNKNAVCASEIQGAMTD